MGRLKALPSRIPTLAPRIGYTQGDTKAQDRSRDAFAPWRRWYHTSKWTKLRQVVLLRDLFTCQKCGRVQNRGMVADHKIPHRGNPALFWDVDNLQCLCPSCHSGAKQAEERASGTRAISSGRMAHPDWFRRAHIPTTIVCGPPGAGKSTYVRQKAGPLDLVVCFDEIATSLFAQSGKERARNNLSLTQIADALRVRNEMIGDLMRSKAADRWRAAWIILTEPDPKDREWWANTLGAKVVVLATPADECARRIARDADSGDVRASDVEREVATWWGRYTPAPCDTMP